MAEATYGGFWIRLLAYAADMSILTFALIVLAIPLTFMGGAGAALYGLIAAIGPIAYFAWLTASDRQATFGKQLCGLAVRHAGSGEQISLLRSIARELGKIISAAILMIGFLLVAFTGRKQGLHDMLASTEVVREGPARIWLALVVAIGGVVIPLIVIPLMFAGMFAGLMAMMMGSMMEDAASKRARPVPQMEQKAAPRPQVSVPQPAPAEAKQAAVQPAKPAATEPAKSAAVEPVKPVAVEPTKPAAAEPPKPAAAAAPIAAPAPSKPAPQPRAATSRSAPVAATPAAPVLQQSKPPCVYKPVMTDEDIARCR